MPNKTNTGRPDGRRVIEAQRPNKKKRMSKKAKRRKKRRIILAVEIVILLIVIIISTVIISRFYVDCKGSLLPNSAIFSDTSLSP